MSKVDAQSEIMLGQLENLMCAVPDAVAKRDKLIALRDGVGYAPHQLVRRLRARSEWRGSSLEELLPGLTIIDPSSFTDRLGVRSANGLRRADIQTWSALANLSPLSIGSLPGIGIDSTEEILLAAVREWADAYLRSVESLAEGKALHRRNVGEDPLKGLIGRTPDPDSDRKLLMRLKDRDDPGTQALIVQLHTAEEWRGLALRELLPGLGLVESRRFSTRLSGRAANGIGREGVSTLTKLAGMSTATILEMPGIGISAVEEIVGVVIDEWASSYLDQREVSASRDQHAKERVEGCGDLTDAFAKIEKASGFDIFRRRHLETGKNPTQREIAVQMAVSPARVSYLERGVQTMLSRLRRNPDWPVAKAVEKMRGHLGSVARRAELEEAISEINPVGQALGEDMPQRRALLLWLADYRFSGEWVVDNEIESITGVLLHSMTEGRAANLDAVVRQLARLGVREELQLPWIVSQPGFQIVDGKLMRIASG